MRVSFEAGDPDHWQQQHSFDERPEIRLHGLPVAGAIEADTDAGSVIVEVRKLDAAMQPTGEVERSTWRGPVEIVAVRRESGVA